MLQKARKQFVAHLINNVYGGNCEDTMETEIRDQHESFTELTSVGQDQELCVENLIEPNSVKKEVIEEEIIYVMDLPNCSQHEKVVVKQELQVLQQENEFLKMKIDHMKTREELLLKKLEGAECQLQAMKKMERRISAAICKDLLTESNH